MKWTKEIPKVVGHYWYRDLNSRHDKEPIVLHVRDYVIKLAIHNSFLEGSSYAKKGEWAGPIDLPEEESIPKMVQCDYAQKHGCNKKVGKGNSRCPHSGPHLQHSLGVNEDSCVKASCWIADCEVQCTEISE